MSLPSQYETVVGLEVHAQLLTKSKLFCGDCTAFGAEPNTQVSAISLAHPGTLPRLNKQAVVLAVKMGLACGCSITEENFFARKNYFYPDLPKGYQISQHTAPICRGGSIVIKTKTGDRKIHLNRIHLEEDAGKSLHENDPVFSSVDYNRAGCPLIEIVTEPELQNGDEAFAFLIEIRRLVRYLDICDGNMEEGSLRCDANISVRKKGESSLGTKVEIKNLNSMRHVRLAIESEEKRQVKLLEEGRTVTQETRSFDESSGTTNSSREKEEADDYRYFTEPDLPAFQLDKNFIESVSKSIPVLPLQRVRHYIELWGLTEQDASVIAEERTFSDYFESLISITSHHKAAANWMLGPVRTWINENKADITSFPVAPESLARLIEHISSGKLSFSVASGRLFKLLLEDPERDPLELAAEHNLLQESDSSQLEPVIEKVLQKFADKVLEYRKGKKGLLALFVGEVMKLTKGKADPKLTNELILKKLNEK